MNIFLNNWSKGQYSLSDFSEYPFYQNISSQKRFSAPGIFTVIVATANGHPFQVLTVAQAA